MGRLIYTELLKLKRSKMFIVGIVGSFIAPFLNFFTMLNNRPYMPNETIEFYQYISQTNLFTAYFLGVLLFGLLTTYIFNREQEEDTLKSILTIPVRRTSLILSKLIVMFIWIELSVTITFGLALIFGTIGGFEGFTIQVVLEYLRVYLFTGFLLFLLCPTIAFITLLFRSYLPSIAFTIMAIVTVTVISRSEFIVFFPWTSHLVILGYAEGLEYPVYYPWISILSTFVISLFSSIVYFKRTDIH